MDNTEILNLPYIMPSQAQKHVTHNEATRQLNALIQLSVVSMEVLEPPSSPIAGARYIIGENASGDWLGLDGQLAAYLDGNWTVFEPLEGWLAHVEDQNIVVLRSGAIWQGFPLPKTLENMDGVGVGTKPDTVNKLSVSADASLFSHHGDNHRLIINKSEESKTASVVFQSNWIGHAEFGLTGSNDFQVKVSDDGSTFQTAMQVDKATGQVQFPLGAQTAARIDFTGLWAANSDFSWVTFSLNYGANQGAYRENAGANLEPVFEPTQVGPIVRKGSRMRSFLTTLKSTHADVTGCNIRLVFQYVESGQEWTDANLQTRVLFAENEIAVSTNSYSMVDAQLSDYKCPENGFLLMFVKPIGSSTGSDYIGSSTSIEVISA